MAIARRLPKRGFTNARFKKEYAIVNIKDLNGFEDGTEVNPAVLKRSGIIKKFLDGVKILGDGELNRQLIVKAHKFSKSAQQKIVGAGGKAVSLLRIPTKGKLKPKHQRSK